MDGEPIDLAKFAELGSKGVLLLMADSTNVEREGFTMSERSVGRALERFFDESEDRRIIVATFASNIHRIQQIVDLAAARGPKSMLFRQKHGKRSLHSYGYRRNERSRGHAYRTRTPGKGALRRDGGYNHGQPGRAHERAGAHGQQRPHQNQALPEGYGYNFSQRHTGQRTDGFKSNQQPLPQRGNSYI